MTFFGVELRAGQIPTRHRGDRTAVVRFSHDCRSVAGGEKKGMDDICEQTLRSGGDAPKKVGPFHSGMIESTDQTASALPARCEEEADGPDEYGHRACQWEQDPHADGIACEPDGKTGEPGPEQSAE